MKINSAYIKKMAQDLGMDLCGITSADRFTNAPEGFHPWDVLPECKSVIVLGMKFLHSSVKSTNPCQYTVTRHQLSFRLEERALQMCEFFESIGESAVLQAPVDPTMMDPRTGKMKGAISLKHAAELAGLGSIGRNTLLVNRKFGNMIWMSGVLTSLELEPDPMDIFDPCPKGCSICSEVCPVKALDDVPPGTLKQLDCYTYAFGDKDGGGWKMHCHACRSKCPNCFSFKHEPSKV